MKSIVQWLEGRKTYIVSIIVIVYAILAYLNVLPKPNDIAAAFVVVSAYAVTFRAALTKLMGDVTKK